MGLWINISMLIKIHEEGKENIGFSQKPASNQGVKKIENTQAVNKSSIYREYKGLTKKNNSH